MRALFALVLACTLLACNIDNPGDPPADERLYFPNALALSSKTDGSPRFLYVANSDFDLRYNAGTVQAYSLDELEAAVDACDPDDARGCSIEPSAVFVDEVPISAFSTSLNPTPSGDRVLVTTRTGDSLSFVFADPDADADVLSCEGGGGGASCGLEGELGIDPHEEDRKLPWEEDPVAVITGNLITDWVDADEPPDPSLEYALVAHRGGQVSLFVEDGSDLVLTDVLPNVAVAATDLAYDPKTRFVYVTTARGTNVRRLDRIGVHVPLSGGVPDPLHATVYDAGTLVLQPVADIEDSRSIAFLPKFDDLGAALATSSAVVATRTPSSLLLVDVEDADESGPTGDRARIGRVKGSAPLGAGPTRVVAGVIDGVPIALVSSFDSRELALVDLRTMLTRSVVPNLSGPYAVALDEARKRVYVGDFRSSVIRIFDLTPVIETGDLPLEIVATLGKPRVLQELR